MILSLLVSLAHGSGYHPDFDQAVDEADWIVLGEVTAALEPAAALSVGEHDQAGEGRVYRVRVERSFAPGAKAPAELYAWDPYADSSASYHVSEAEPNLSFLVLDPSVTARDGTPVGQLIRNLASGPGWAQGRDDWLALLRWTKTGRRPLSYAHVRGAVDDPDSGRILLRYALEHWPGELSDDDAAAVGALVEARADDALVVSAAVRLLREQGRPLGGAALRAALLGASPLARSDLVEDIDATNVAQVRDVLWQWLVDDAEGALYGLGPLAAHDPSWLRARIEETVLPFWLDIPVLSALGLSPADAGRDWPVTTDNPWALSDLGKLVKGDPFGIRFGMTRRDEETERLLPLLVPHLPEMTEGCREAAVAALRTAGFSVARAGDGAELGPREDLPLRLVVEPLSHERVQLVVYADEPVLVCDRFEPGTEVAGPKGSVLRSAMHGEFGPAPADCFAERLGEFVRVEVDVSDLAEGAGSPATVSAEVLFTHPGTEHGLDGWTGMLLSEPVPLP